MNELGADLEDLMRCACVLFKVNEHRAGTGFFVSPKLVVTCGHVVRPYLERSRTLALRLFHSLNNHLSPLEVDHIEVPIPDVDLALVFIRSFESPHYFCIDPSYVIGDECYCWGFSKNNPAGDPARPRVAGTTGADPQLEPDPLKRGLLKLDAAQISPGHSGSPLVNLRTRGVLGIIRETRSEDRSEGGYAIPVLGLLPVLAQYQVPGQPPQRESQARPAAAPPNAVVCLLAAINEPVSFEELGQLLGADRQGVADKIKASSDAVKSDGNLVWLTGITDSRTPAARETCSSAARRLSSLISNSTPSPAVKRLWHHVLLLWKCAGQVNEAVGIIKRIVQPDYLELHPVAQTWALVSEFDLSHCSPKDRAYILNVQGVLLREMGKLRLSRQKCAQALQACERESPLSFVVSQNLAHVLFELGEVEAALELIRPAARTAVDGPSQSKIRRMCRSASRRDYAVMLAQLGRFAEAHEQLDTGVDEADASMFQRSLALDRAFLGYLRSKKLLSEGKRTESDAEVDAALTLLESLPASIRVRESLDREFLMGCLHLQRIESGDGSAAREISGRLLISAAATSRELGLPMLRVEAMLALSRSLSDSALLATMLKLLDPDWTRLGQIYLATASILAAKQGRAAEVKQNSLQLKDTPFLHVRSDLKHAESIVRTGLGDLLAH